MTPTNELRFVERQANENVADGKLVKVLQQMWAQYWSEDMGGGKRVWEWRDVPTDRETT